jgi:hypothetical protein
VDAFLDVLPGSADAERITVNVPGLFPPALDAGFLDLEKIREIRFSPYGKDTLERFDSMVTDSYLFLDAGPHFPQPLHNHGTVRITVPAGRPASKQGPVWLLRLGRQRFERAAVKGDAPMGQNARVLEEDTMGKLGMDVPVG